MCQARAIALACIDIGSNTTRLLVAEVAGGRLVELGADRAFTHLGRAAAAHGGVVLEAKLAEIAAVVTRQAGLARSLGAGRIEVVATAALREARNGADAVAALERDTGLPVRVLSGDEEGRLAFAGAARALQPPVAGPLAVVDVGGGSTEVAVGTVTGGAERCQSFRVGSGVLADAYLGADPPGAGELEALRRHARAELEGLAVGPVEAVVAVGGSATSLRRLVGAALDAEALGRALALLAATPAAEVAARFGLDAERVRLLPAGIGILEAVALRIGRAPVVGSGGLREGLLLALAAGG